MFRYCGVALEFEYICGHSKNVLKIKMAYETDLTKNLFVDSETKRKKNRKSKSFLVLCLLSESLLPYLQESVTLKLSNKK